MSAETADLLIEVGCEELPPKYLANLSTIFSDAIKELLEAKSFVIDDTNINKFATPRRLAILFKEVPIKSHGAQVTQWGPPINIAFDKAGNPTPAAVGFAKKCGVTFEQLEQKEGKLFFSYIEKDSYVKDLIANVINEALRTLPIPKRMRWGANKHEFVRPVHWIVALLGNNIISDEIFDLTPSRITYGHRFHHPNAIEIKNPADYVEALRKTKVEPDFNVRRESIRTQVVAAAEKLSGVVHINEDLLEEVTALVEWPVALTGNFDKQFLDVPHEALVSTMTGNQKYFPVFDNAGKLLPYFIFITNIESKDPAQIIAGNEKVIRPRFSDAKFFFEQDKKVALEDLADNLQHVVFQKELGSIFNKCTRVADLFRTINKTLNYNFGWESIDAPNLCKADLLSSMVSEFPELQGVMGKYYALHQGKPTDVAVAIEEHYLPRFSGDHLPSTNMGTTLALADRLDTLAGIFAINQAPTGDKDPFALRRASLSVLRIIIEKHLNLDLYPLIKNAVDAVAPQGSQLKIDHEKTIQSLLSFILDRLQGIYFEQGISTQSYLVTRAQNITSPLDFDAHIKAVHAVSELPEIKSLASANKRIANILTKTDNSFVIASIKELELTLPEEKQLYATFSQVKDKTHEFTHSKNYKEALLTLAALKEPVDAFFDGVMVNAEDVNIRNSRLNLLRHVRELFLSVADISLLSISK